MFDLYYIETSSAFYYIFHVLLLVGTYKALDWLIRRPYIRGYDGRYILVTGCDMGFGNILAKRLDKLGCHVFAGCLTTAGGEELKKQCSDKLKVVTLDVANPDSVQKAFQTVKATLPEGKGLWGVMNNAGIAGELGPPEWLSLKAYKDVAAINTYGLIDVSMTFLPLVKLERGRVVNTASIYGRMTLANLAPYCVSKYGVEAFTDCLRRSLYPFGVKAILIEPGLHKTNIISIKGMQAVAERTWSQVPQAIKEEFGEEYFQYFVKKGLTEFDGIASNRLDDVVDAYQHALLGFFPRASYMPGKDAKFPWLPIHWAPEWLGDLILRRLDPNQPLPAALLKKNK
jgi:NAD(P)-dependent dehydrogenase (short-subunit alcohol dehydrogenase family)